MVPRRPGHISSKATVSPGDGQRWATSPVELCRRRREALQRPAMLLPASTGRPLEKTTQKARFQPTHCSRALRGGSSPSKQREPARFHSVHIPQHQKREKRAPMIASPAPLGAGLWLTRHVCDTLHTYNTCGLYVASVQRLLRWY